MSPSSAGNSPVIEMHDVAVSAIRDPNTHVAEGIDWIVRAGDYWVIAGLQGSGKTDFLMMTGGVMPPAQGQYRLLGEEMPIFDEARLKHRLRLGLVFDGGQLLNHLTVSENIALPIRYHRNLTRAEAEEEVQKIMETLELGPWAESTPGALGRNWQKRVGLARALSLKPEVLLIDSPLTGLDLRHINWWLGFLDQLSKGCPLLQDRPMTLVITAADVRFWRGGTRQFAVLREKKLTVLGSWQQLETGSQELLREVYDHPTD